MGIRCMRRRGDRRNASGGRTKTSRGAVHVVGTEVVMSRPHHAFPPLTAFMRLRRIREPFSASNRGVQINWVATVTFAILIVDPQVQFA